MSPGPSPHENFEAFLDFVGDEDLDRIDAMSAAEIQAGLAAMGLGSAEKTLASDVPAPAETLKDGPEGASDGDVAQVVDLAPPPPAMSPKLKLASVPPAHERGRERSPMTSRFRILAEGRLNYFAAAAIVLVLVGHSMGLFGRHDVADKPHPAPSASLGVGPVVAPVPPQPPAPVVDKEGAARDRVAAEAACKKSDWATCAALLDAADNLDPEGIFDPKTLELRGKIDKRKSSK